jgi:DNA-binding XRE family transcriptional regulator
VSVTVGNDQEVATPFVFAVTSRLDLSEDVRRGTSSGRIKESTFLITESRHCVNLFGNEHGRSNNLVTRARTTKIVRLSSDSPHSLVRTRTTSKKKSRKRSSPKNLAEKLRLVREHLGMSQGEIAKALGIDNRASISGYERGEREPPLPILLAYARLAKVSVESLIDDDLDVLL